MYKDCNLNVYFKHNTLNNFNSRGSYTHNIVVFVYPTHITKEVIFQMFISDSDRNLLEF